MTGASVPLSASQEERRLDFTGSDTAYQVRLDIFEGPLDLLLHLIRKSEVDICNIPIAEITRQYLEYIRMMKELNLEVAGEFLLMASTLLHIKSRMLLPVPEPEEGQEEEEDPRAELVRRLLEYQQYKDAGQLIGSRVLLGREVYLRGSSEESLKEIKEDSGVIEVELFELVDAFRDLLSRLPAETFHDVAPVDTFSIADCIHEILSLLQERDMIFFDDLLGVESTRERIIVYFLALLELCRLKLVRVFQNERGGIIWLVPAVTEDFQSSESE